MTIGEAPGRQLVVLSCSATKRNDSGLLPALERYNGPMYQVLRSFLRQAEWPAPLSVAVLSAKYGLIGGLASIDTYDQRMTRDRSADLRKGSSTELLRNWSQSHGRVNLLLGKDYLSALDLDTLDRQGVETEVVKAPIGMKLNGLKTLLHGLEHRPRFSRPEPSPGRMLYFLPDWDDMLDEHFDFRGDRFSAPKKADRQEVHCTRLMADQRMCDGVLVSLAQHMAVRSKGALKKFASTDAGTLAPEPMRHRFGLSENQWLFGDCGAFSYVNKPEPDIESGRALAMYQLYGFDFGASVDHIPVPVISTLEGKRFLSPEERVRRVDITKENAAEFIALHRKRKCTFVPVGVIQGLDPESYARQLREYVDMGYEHVGIGGLVPRSDKDILEVVQALDGERRAGGLEPWIHLFGVYRPKIHRQLREFGATSFDSATYFRKAWLRSGQNYLNPDGKSWHAAIRIPMTSDPRTRKRLEASNLPLNELAKLEREALDALHEYDDGRRSLESTIQAVEAYDFLLKRGEDHGVNLIPAYEQTLAERPWEKCGCAICQSTGIDVVIFRGANRNKRRGTHNTAILYESVVGRD